MGDIIKISTIDGLQDMVSGAEELSFDSLQELIDSGQYGTLGKNVYTGEAEILQFEQYGKATEGLTGGTKYGVKSIDIVEGAGGVGVTGAVAGATVQLGLGAVVGGILGGVGLGIIATELSPEFWIGVSNAIFGTDITYDEISNYYIKGIYTDGKTFVPEDVVQKTYEYLRTHNAKGEPYIDEEQIAIFSDSTPRVVEITGIEPTRANIYMLASKLWNDPLLNTHGITSGQFFSAVAEALDHLPAFVAATSFSVDVTVQFDISVLPGRYACIVDLSLFNRDFSSPITWQRQSNKAGGYTISPYHYSTELEPYRVAGSRGIGYSDNTHTGTSGGFNIIPYIRPRYLFSGSETEAYSIAMGSYSYDQELTDGITVNDKANVYDPAKDLEQNYDAWINNRRFIHAVKMIAGVPPEIIEVPYIPVQPDGVDPYREPEAYPKFEPDVELQPDKQSGDAPEPAEDPEPDPEPSDDPTPDPVPPPDKDPDPTPLPPPWEVPEDIKKPKPVPPEPDPDPDPEEPIPPPNTDPDPEDGGDTPIPIPPVSGSGTANALFKIYNPTQAQLNSLGAYLWSDSIIDVLARFLENPMDAIISLHMIYAKPVTNGSQNIKLGYLDSGVSSLVVSNQYVNVYCGVLRVPETYGTVEDYAPYTSISIYLPFIGVRELETNLVMGSKLSVNYSVDVLTGTCLATISVSKDNSSAIMYHFDGNCGIQLPLTGADKSRLLSGIISAGVGVATGGAVGGVIGGLLGGTPKISINKSGNIGSNAGAMDIKTPYLIITRSKPYRANNYNRFYGIPSNNTVYLGNCFGYTRVKDIHIDSISNATNDEKTMIESLLKSGVVIQ